MLTSKIFYRAVFSFICFLCCQTLAAAPNTSSKELEQRLKEIKSLRANFQQTVKESGKVVQKTKGYLYLQRPGQFRWQALTPMAQLILSDGKTLWIYEEDLEQVTVKKLDKNIRGTPALFLSGYTDGLDKIYNISSNSLSKNGITYTLSPKQSLENNYKQIMLTYKGRYLQKILIEDNIGQLTELIFSNLQLNPKLDNKLFKFIPPKGVDIIYQ